MVTTVHAQSTSALDARLNAALNPPLATVTTDTGTFAPGRRDFSRYDTPQLCLAAVRGTRNAAQISLEAQLTHDTLRNAQHDTIGVAAARVVAQACATRFFTALSTTSDLPVLFALAILIQDDTLALRVLNTQLAHVSAPAAQSALRLVALDSLLGVSRRHHAPLQLAADAVLAELARDTSFQTQMQARELVFNYWESRDSLPALQHAASALLDLLRHAPPQASDDRSLKSLRSYVYRMLMERAFFQGIDSMTAVAAQAQRDDVFNGAARQPVHDVINRLAGNSLNWDPATRPVAPSLDAAFWYPVPTGKRASVPIAAPVFPVSGVVTLLVVGGGARVATRVREWLARYRATDMQVVMLDQTDDTAAYWYDPSGDYLNGPMTPSERAEQSRWYYQEYEQLPVAVAVRLRKVTFAPWPSERRTVPAGAPNNLEPGMMMIIMRDGHLLYQGNMLGRPGSSMMSQLIAWAVAQSGAPSTSTKVPGGCRAKTLCSRCYVACGTAPCRMMTVLDLF